MERRCYLENLKGEKYWEQIFQCMQKCEEINSGLKYAISLKMLILGYKHLRRGEDWYDTDHENIVVRQMWLHENLEEIINHFNVVSFDNLAIKQLDVKRLMSEEDWDEFYMGDDGNYTFYLDLVEGNFGKNSLATDRYPIMDNIDDMFQKIVSKN